MIQDSREDESRERPTCAGVPRSREEPSRGHRCPGDVLRHRPDPAPRGCPPEDPRRGRPVGFPRRPARSVAADQVNVACYQATPWLASFGALRATRPRARPRFPLTGSPPARGQAESVGASTDTRTLLPSRTDSRRNRAGRLESGATRGRDAPTNADRPSHSSGEERPVEWASTAGPDEPERRAASIRDDAGHQASATEAGITPEGAPPSLGELLMQGPGPRRCRPPCSDPKVGIRSERACAPGAEAPETWAPERPYGRTSCGIRRAKPPEPWCPSAEASEQPGSCGRSSTAARDERTIGFQWEIRDRVREVWLQGLAPLERPYQKNVD